MCKGWCEAWGQKELYSIIDEACVRLFVCSSLLVRVFCLLACSSLCVCVSARLFVYVCLSLSHFVRLCVCVYLCACACVYVCIYMYVSLYVCAYMRMRACVSIRSLRLLKRTVETMRARIVHTHTQITRHCIIIKAHTP